MSGFTSNTVHFETSEPQAARFRNSVLLTPRFRNLLVLAAALALVADAGFASRRFPHVLLVAVDTLRLDRLSAYGYSRPTSPAIDGLLGAGARFSEMRAVEPLTAPSMASMFTSRYPHEHGATRNGLSVRPGLPSLGKVLGRRGYETAAFVGNWTLRAEMSGLGEHFESFDEVFSRKRWLGLFNSEATAADLTDATLAWIGEHLDKQPKLPFFAWVHYVEPHAPYRLHEEYLERLGIDRKGGHDVAPADRYDTEIAFVDTAIGRLLAGIKARVPEEDLLVIFVSDHGESLGEHDYWGHGRHLYEATLHVPFGITWRGRIRPQSVPDLASTLDLAPTVLGLVGLPIPEPFRGHDWSPNLTGAADPPPGPPATFHQAHKGALRGGGSEAARRKGLLAVGWVTQGRKEVYSVRGRGERLVFDLTADRAEVENLATGDDPASEVLGTWLSDVRAGLKASDELPAPALDEEAIERLRSLGYIDD